MCDETDLARFAGRVRSNGFSRRSFGAAGMAVGLAACTQTATNGATGASGSAATTGGLAETMVSIPTADGTMDAFFVHPAEPAAAVIVWPDIAGLRDAFKAMARRLAGEGYAVLVANPYYRDVAAPQFADFAGFMAVDGFQKVSSWRAKMDADAVMRDTRSLVAWLDSQGAVDTDKGIGTQGYCMGGPYTVWSAAAVPGRVKAAASFHGGGLVREGGQSPHAMLQDTQAGFLFAIAQNDDAKQPEAKTILRQSADAAGRSAEIEVYPADHGWTVPDSPAYNREQAERAWGRLLALYRTALG
ncbi:dienelactone hydrolase family protein [Altererythrobacter sp. FM1]|uniref:dienelactone hydrolase family protein n=1 Tax=Tsuneonella flava TaxID=2055955 RepID=UPI000C7FCCF9|nr:dienelactone hydrolase family protein [Tsuneonella flava]ROT97302.1 dienelactone hydrolase family protein [Altererythrobacter sp. FM1]